MQFPANAGLIFLTDKLTNDRYLVDTGETLSIVPCNQNSNPSGPLLKGADGQRIPSWGFIQKSVQFQSKFSASQRGWSHSRHWLFEKIQGHCCSRNQPNTVCLHCSGLASPLFAFSGLARPFFAFSGLIRLILAAYFYTGISSGSNPAACCDEFFPASCHICTCSLESRGEVIQL